MPDAISRRALLMALPALGIASSIERVSAAAASEHRVSILGDLRTLTIAELEHLYIHHSCSVVSIVEAHLTRARLLNPVFHPFVRMHEEDACTKAGAEDRAARLGELPGPLRGVPIAIKDNTAMAGYPLTDGWNGYGKPGHVFIPRRNATVVERLMAAGAIVLGQTNMPDFAKSDSNVSSIGGRTGNVYDVHFSPGGSSGGTAVAVSSGLVVLGQGTDTGNSIRNPASNAGVVGILPTHGMVSMAGIHPYDWLLDNTGPIARTVRDAAIGLDAMAGADPLDPQTLAVDRRRLPRAVSKLKSGALRGKRLGVPRFVIEGSPATRNDPKFWNHGTSPQTKELFFVVLAELRALGAAIVIHDNLMPESFDAIAQSINTKPYRGQGVDRFLAAYGPAGMTSMAEYRTTTGDAFPLELLTDGIPQAILQQDPAAARNYFIPRRDLQRAYARTFADYKLDALVYPALQVPPNDERLALPTGYPSDGPYSATNWINRLGAPAVVVPAGFYADQLPFGIEFSGQHWGDAALIGLAYSYEQSTHHRRPPPFAL